MQSKQQDLEKLYQEYKHSIPTKLLQLEELMQAWCITQDSSVLEKLKAAIHRLAGSAGTYGYAQVSVECKLLEQHLQSKVLNDLVCFDYLERIKNGFGDGI